MTDSPKSYATEDVEAALARLDAIVDVARSWSPLAAEDGHTRMAGWLTDLTEKLRGAAVSTPSPEDVVSTPSAEDAVRSYFEGLKTETAQDAAWDRNSWQRRLGAVVTYIEEAVRRWHDPHAEEVEWKVVLDNIYRIINTNPLTDRIDDPYADIAVVATKQTVLAFMEAGMIIPGPNAPAWLRQAAGEVVEEESDEEEGGDEEDEA